MTRSYPPGWVEFATQINAETEAAEEAAREEQDPCV